MSKQCTAQTTNFLFQYAGTYVPYIANYIYEHPTLLDLKLKGFWISDRELPYWNLDDLPVTLTCAL